VTSHGMTRAADHTARHALNFAPAIFCCSRKKRYGSALAVMWAAFALASTLSGASAAVQAAANSFGLYLPAEPLPPQVLLHGTNDLSRIRLAASPVISEADIVAYDFAQHVMKLQPGAVDRITHLLTNRPNSAFVAVAEGAPAYLGVFARFDSLEQFEQPVIITDWRYEEQPSDTFAITWPFPPGVAPGTRQDPRDDERIKAALTPLKKLQRLGVPYRSVVTRKVTLTNAIPSRMAHFLSAQFMAAESEGNTNDPGAAARGRSGPRHSGLVLLVGDPHIKAVMVSGPQERMLPTALVIRALDGVPSPELWPDGTLGPDEAQALGLKLANAKARATYGVEPFRDGTPTWAGRWFWNDVQKISQGEIRAVVSFEANGSNQVVTVSLPNETPQERKPKGGF
jgi:hypothetical protein